MIKKASSILGYLYLVFVLLLTSQNLMAQPESSRSKKEKHEAIIKLVDREITILKAYIQDIADKRVDRDIRTKKIDKVLRRFSKNATIEISNVNTQKKRPLEAKKYFMRLRDLKYANVEITWEKNKDLEKIDLKELGNGEYELSGRYIQKFRGFNKQGKLQYGDLTIKKVFIKVVDKKDGGGQAYREIIITGIKVETTLKL